MPQRHPVSRRASPSVAKSETLVARGETLAARGETLVARGETLAAKGETLVARGETLVARGETLVAKGETLAARAGSSNGAARHQPDYGYDNDEEFAAELSRIISRSKKGIGVHKFNSAAEAIKWMKS